MPCMAMTPECRPSTEGVVTLFSGNNAIFTADVLLTVVRYVRQHNSNLRKDLRKRLWSWFRMICKHNIDFRITLRVV